ncbi:cupin domain-containing protein [Luteimonas weifangensis]|uniref:Cupin domain-containing protein n=2 Tax=Cognatiluteimonas weifangensis TaxID=2303539 RepID=A0A372DN49_9GAMM|nr:cupin domain-containing protein [Luteimonas weifangensis]
MKLAMAVAAAGSLYAAATAAVAGTVLGGATVTNGARGTVDGKVINGPVKIIMPDVENEQIDVMAANINLPANGGGIDWHTHPGPTFGIVTGGGTLTIIDDDCVAHEYATGEAFVPPENPHTARNYSNLPVTIRATFFMAHTSPPTAPTTFLSEYDDDVMDAYCRLAE